MKGTHVIIQLIVVLPFFINCSTTKKPEIKVISNAFKNDSLIPAKYSCDGENISPQLKWSKGPKGTKTFVLICDDPDAPAQVWVHWLIYNIPSTILEIPENAAEIKGAKYGTTDFGNTNYGGPCPPDGTHHYHFKIYALDCELPLATGATKENIESAMKNHILAKGEMIGMYARKK
jgi:Raf kinase inhibitor-like YbhB/YbcL family protein